MSTISVALSNTSQRRTLAPDSASSRRQSSAVQMRRRQPSFHRRGASRCGRSLQAALRRVGQKPFPSTWSPRSKSRQAQRNFLLAAAIEALARRSRSSARRASIGGPTLICSLHNLPGARVQDLRWPDRRSRFQPAAFAAPLGFKDIRLALAAAESLRVPMPLGSLLHDRFLRLLAQGGDSLDWAAIGGLAAQDAGDAPTDKR